MKFNSIRVWNASRKLDSRTLHSSVAAATQLEILEWINVHSNKNNKNKLKPTQTSRTIPAYNLEIFQ